MEEATVLNKKKVKLVPKLRFKGFEEGWEKKELGDVTNYVKGFAFKTENYQSSGIRIIRVSDLGADKIKDVDEKIFIKEDEVPLYEKYNLKAGNIIITTVGSKPEMIESAVGRGIFVKQNGEGLLNQNLLKFDNIKGVDNGFIIGLINSKRYQSHIKGIARGNANQANITVVDLLQYKISIPTFPEQQKIATFLSSVDEKLQQLTRKKELLEQYKKGVMQQLFSGKLRFKDENGKSYPKWEEKRLGEVGNTFNGLTGKTKENFGEGKPYIQYKQIFDDSKIDITKCGLVQINEHEKQQKVKYGDVFFTTSSETPNEIGTSSVLLDLTEEMYLNSFCFGFRPKSFKQLLPDYAKYLFRSPLFRRIIIRLAQGSTRYNMSKVEFMTLKIKLPSIAEQEKIAKYLTSIDKKIETIKKEITATQEFKKGLLQQMFV